MTAEARFVADASVVIKWFLPEIFSSEASLLLRHHAGALLAPDFLTVEAGNVMLKKVRANLTPEAYARDALARIPSQVVLLPSQHLRDAAFSIALQYNRSFYDALYVALALEQGCRLVTADQRLYNALSPALPDTMLWLGDAAIP